MKGKLQMPKKLPSAMDSAIETDFVALRVSAGTGERAPESPAAHAVSYEGSREIQVEMYWSLEFWPLRLVDYAA